MTAVPIALVGVGLEKEGRTLIGPWSYLDRCPILACGVLGGADAGLGDAQVR